MRMRNEPDLPVNFDAAMRKIQAMPGEAWARKLVMVEAVDRVAGVFGQECPDAWYELAWSVRQTASAAAEAFIAARKETAA